MENEKNVVQGIINDAIKAETDSGAASENVSEKRCVKCQAVIKDGQAFCPECGASQKVVCSNCGAEIKDGQSFCQSCGQKVGESANVTTENAAINQFNANVAVSQQNKKLIPIIIGGVAVVFVAIIAVLVLSLGGGFDFEEEFSDIKYESWCEIAEDGSYMKIDTNPYDLDDTIEMEAWEKIEDINRKLGFSDALMDKMGQTRSLDGRQSDENEDFEVSWTYHPDDGLEIMYEKK